MNPDAFHDAWQFLYNHPAFVYDPEGRDFRALDTLSVEVTKVNPDTGEREDDQNLNTKVEVWLEWGPYQTDEDMVEHLGEDWESYTGGEPYGCHDYDLDCGEPTYEEAIIKLAELVRKHYNDDGTHREYCQKCEKEILGEGFSQCRVCHDYFCDECGKSAFNAEGLCGGCAEWWRKEFDEERYQKFFGDKQEEEAPPPQPHLYLVP